MQGEKNMACKENVEKLFHQKAKSINCVDKNGLLNIIADYVPLKDVLAFSNELIDDKFRGIMENEEMARCVEYFFECDLNVAETSRKSFLHRNTLLYRLDRIQGLTGLNIRHFDDAVTFKILMMIYNLTK